MQAIRSDAIRGAALGLICATAIAVIAIPVLVWGRDHAVEFFGAFAAAIVAAIAVVLGAYYQAALTRQRDDEVRKQEQFAQAVDLYHWLFHAVREMEFIADVLLGIGRHLAEAGQAKLDWPVEQYRDVVSSAFMTELLARAKCAAQLQPDLANPVTEALYKCFTSVDRIHRLRGIPDAYRPTADAVMQHEKIARIDVERLTKARDLLTAYVDKIERRY